MAKKKSLHHSKRLCMLTSWLSIIYIFNTNGEKFKSDRQTLNRKPTKNAVYESAVANNDANSHRPTITTNDTKNRADLFISIAMVLRKQ